MGKDVGLANAPLGKRTHYDETYNPALLCPISRAQGRQSLVLPPGLSGFGQDIYGVDIWNAYELSWLNQKGKPCVAMAECYVPCSSDSIVESKSFKLYLNSFNQTIFSDANAVHAALQKDLSEATGSKVTCRLMYSDESPLSACRSEHAVCLDALDVTVTDYLPNPALLVCVDPKQSFVKETLCSHLLKSNCPVTDQPDWGSVWITYEGVRIDHEGILKYIISYRKHNEFHEHCVERMFVDIMNCCHPSKLTVFARYTRRGGLDINPYRSNFETSFANAPAFRQ